MAPKNKDPKPTHFNQERRRKAEFIRPPNTLKAKVGSGGLNEEIIDKAQHLLEDNTADFQPLADLYLAALTRGLEQARRGEDISDRETIISGMLYPAMQLKANGGMFKYPLVTHMADKMVQFLEVLAVPDADALEIVLAFHTAIRAVVMGRVAGDGGARGKELTGALDEACHRYFDRHPYNRTDVEQDYGEEF